MIRCMTAIWPAGPPKLSTATLSQTRNASPIDGSASRAGAGTAAEIADASVNSRSRFRMPGVGLRGRVPAPPVERVVEPEAGFELSEVVGIHARQPQRGGQ